MVHEETNSVNHQLLTNEFSGVMTYTENTEKVNIDLFHKSDQKSLHVIKADSSYLYFNKDPPIKCIRVEHQEKKIELLRLLSISLSILLISQFYNLLDVYKFRSNQIIYSR